MGFTTWFSISAASVSVIIGAGALIPPGKVIPSKSLVVGSPGKVVKTLNEEALQSLLTSSEVYVKEASLHKKI